MFLDKACLSIYLFVHMITYKVMNEFPWNVYQRCVSGLGTILPFEDDRDYDPDSKQQFD